MAKTILGSAWTPEVKKRCFLSRIWSQKVVSAYAKHRHLRPSGSNP